jgi:hypothetical protein
VAFGRPSPWLVVSLVGRLPRSVARFLRFECTTFTSCYTMEVDINLEHLAFTSYIPEKLCVLGQGRPSIREHMRRSANRR